MQRLVELQSGTPAPMAVVPEGEVKSDPWKGMIGIGLVVITGNAETVMGTANAGLDKKLGEWAFGLRASGAYGQSRPPAGVEAEVTAARAGLLLRGERNIVSFASIYALAGTETDHVKSVEIRGFAEVGTGIKFYERKEGDLEKMFLRGDVGLRYSHETRFQYYASPLVPKGTGLPSATMLGPRIGIVIRYALNKEIRFSEEAEFLPNLLGPSRYLVNSMTKVSARLTESLSFTGSFLVNYDSAPAADKKTTDTALVLGVDAIF